MMWAWECGGLEPNRLLSPSSLSLMRRGCRECWVQEDSEDERQPGSISSVGWELRDGEVGWGTGDDPATCLSSLAYAVLKDTNLC